MAILSEMTETVPAPADRFEVLFERFYAELFALAYRVLGERMASEDSVQEALLKLSDEPHLQQRPDAEVGAWLRRVVLNLAFNRVRHERRGRARLERVGRLEGVGRSELGDTAEAPHLVLLRMEDQAEVRRALAELPERQRECLLLRHSGYSYAEIAATLGVAVGSVGVLLARAEHAFRATYKREVQ
jgi:RNA polymerase sigma factor (sigma-70 family)